MKNSLKFNLVANLKVAKIIYFSLSISFESILLYCMFLITNQCQRFSVATLGYLPYWNLEIFIYLEKINHSRLSITFLIRWYSVNSGLSIRCYILWKNSKNIFGQPNTSSLRNLQGSNSCGIDQKETIYSPFYPYCESI